MIHILILLGGIRLNRTLSSFLLRHAHHKRPTFIRQPLFHPFCSDLDQLKGALAQEQSPSPKLARFVPQRTFVLQILLFRPYTASQSMKSGLPTNFCNCSMNLTNSVCRRRCSNTCESATQSASSYQRFVLCNCETACAMRCRNRFRPCLRALRGDPLPMVMVLPCIWIYSWNNVTNEKPVYTTDHTRTTNS